MSGQGDLASLREVAKSARQQGVGVVQLSPQQISALRNMLLQRMETSKVSSLMLHGSITVHKDVLVSDSTFLQWLQKHGQQQQQQQQQTQHQQVPPPAQYRNHPPQPASTSALSPSASTANQQSATAAVKQAARSQSVKRRERASAAATSKRRKVATTPRRGSARSRAAAPAVQQSPQRKAALKNGQAVEPSSARAHDRSTRVSAASAQPSGSGTAFDVEPDLSMLQRRPLDSMTSTESTAAGKREKSRGPQRSMSMSDSSDTDTSQSPSGSGRRGPAARVLAGRSSRSRRVDSSSSSQDEEEGSDQQVTRSQQSSASSGDGSDDSEEWTPRLRPRRAEARFSAYHGKDTDDDDDHSQSADSLSGSSDADEDDNTNVGSDVAVGVSSQTNRDRSGVGLGLFDAQKRQSRQNAHPTTNGSSAASASKPRRIKFTEMEMALRLDDAALDALDEPSSDDDDDDDDDDSNLPKASSHRSKRSFAEKALSFDHLIDSRAVESDIEEDLLQNRKRRFKHKATRRRKNQLPHHLINMMGQANAAFAVKEFDRAIELCKQIVEEAPLCPDPFTTMGMVYLEQNNVEEAIRNKMLAAQRRRPMMASDFVEIGQLCISSENGEWAVDCLKKAVRLEPDNVEALAALGTLFERRNDIKAAVMYYAKVVRLMPEDVSLCASLHKLVTSPNLSSSVRRRVQTEAAKALLDCIHAKHDSTSVNVRLVRLTLDLHFRIEAFDEVVKLVYTFLEKLRLGTQASSVTTTTGQQTERQQARLSKCAACRHIVTGQPLKQFSPKLPSKEGAADQSKGPTTKALELASVSAAGRLLQRFLNPALPPGSRTEEQFEASATLGDKTMKAQQHDSTAAESTSSPRRSTRLAKLQKTSGFAYFDEDDESEDEDGEEKSGPISVEGVGGVVRQGPDTSIEATIDIAGDSENATASTQDGDLPPSTGAAAALGSAKQQGVASQRAKHQQQASPTGQTQQSDKYLISGLRAATLCDQQTADGWLVPDDLELGIRLKLAIAFLGIDNEDVHAVKLLAHSFLHDAAHHYASLLEAVDALIVSDLPEHALALCAFLRETSVGNVPAVWLRQAKAVMALGQAPEALHLIEFTLQSVPTHAEARSMLDEVNKKLLSWSKRKRQRRSRVVRRFSSEEEQSMDDDDDFSFLAGPDMNLSDVDEDVAASDATPARGRSSKSKRKSEEPSGKTLLKCTPQPANLLEKLEEVRHNFVAGRFDEAAQTGTRLCAYFLNHHLRQLNGQLIVRATPDNEPMPPNLTVDWSWRWAYGTISRRHVSRWLLFDDAIDSGVKAAPIHTPAPGASRRKKIDIGEQVVFDPGVLTSKHWLELFCRTLQTLLILSRPDQATAMVVRALMTARVARTNEATHKLRFLKAECYLASGHISPALAVLRGLALELPTSPRLWSLVAAVDGTNPELSGTLRTLARLQRKHCKSSVLATLMAGQHLSTSSLQHAIMQLKTCIVDDSTEPLNLLCLMVACLRRALTRRCTEESEFLAAAFAAADRYIARRGGIEQSQEAAFNLGRVYDFVGLPYLAHQFYLRVLSMDSELVCRIKAYRKAEPETADSPEAAGSKALMTQNNAPAEDGKKGGDEARAHSLTAQPSDSTATSGQQCRAVPLLKDALKEPHPSLRQRNRHLIAFYDSYAETLASPSNAQRETEGQQAAQEAVVSSRTTAPDLPPDPTDLKPEAAYNLAAQANASGDRRLSRSLLRTYVVF